MRGQEGFLNRLTKSLQLPEDLSKGEVLVSVRGRNCLTVENFKGISCYTPGEIKLVTKKGYLCISGKNLKIVFYTKDEIEISGCICKVEIL